MIALCFRYLDLLGMSATAGIELVARFAWYAESHGIVDYNQEPFTVG